MTENITIPLVVELGRKSMTLQQVGELQKDQIIELTEAPNDPVSLLVSGKNIGQGELIEVEGKMAVKILSISGT
ncbi:MAG: FliM/FliN family flagellar motor switch protein [Myxococcaceae bacterium]